MPRPGSVIPKAPVVDIMQQGGAERVADEAAEVMVEYLIDYGEKISARALEIARHSGRKTIKAGDIKVALK